MNILLCAIDDTLRNALTFWLESELKVKVIDSKNTEAAMEHLLSDTPLGLIVTAETEATLLKYLVSIESKTPIAFYSSNPETLSKTFPDLKVLGGFGSDNYKDFFSKNVSPLITQGDETPTSAKGYTRIKTELLLQLSPLKADVFIRLSDSKFIRLFQSGDSFDQTDVRKYVHGKNVQHLYLKSENAPIVMGRLHETIQKALKSGVLGPSPAPAMAVNIHNLTMDLQRELGFTPEVQELVRQNVQVVMAGVKKDQTLTDILKPLMAKREEYLAAHSVLVGHIASSIATRLTWSSERTLEKIIFAGLLHDVSIKDLKMNALDDFFELEGKERVFANEEEKQTYLNHPLESAGIAQLFSQIPPDVDTVIAQHHERPDGTGFPKGLGATHLAPLSALFIFCHDVVRATLSGRITFKDVLETYKTKYNKGNFKSIIEAASQEG